ncbi:Porphobilinogen deaminase [Geodia barretti]|uniref:hydroxymethylbilane synthase n=1 Tax=Geodia barretti TaxID=519541 RepID=A0AA35TP34_GEOBA|nr:Porphobilinogen deaminase [Geodia barretti]
MIQTELTLNILKAAHPGIEFLPVTVTTSGDADQRAPLAGMGLGVFVKEIEYRLEKGEIDMAVHSLKDMPTALPDGMCIGAVLERADPRDVFVSHLGTTLGDFPEGKRIGTSSPRRKAQLARRRPDLEIVPIRGNVDTRLRKAAGEECDGTIAAAAGLIRMGLEDVITEYLPTTEFVPPPGQGAMAVEIREGDDWMHKIVLAANHCDTEASVAAERGFLEALGGGCQTPVGAYAQTVSTNLDDLALTVFLSSTDGATAFRATVVGAKGAPAELAAAAWNDLRQQGAGSLLASS